MSSSPEAAPAAEGEAVVDTTATATGAISHWQGMKRILVATDGSLTVTDAIGFAIDFASARQAELIFVHVVPTLDLVAPLGLEEHLVALGVGELHDLVFDGRTIPRPSSADRPAVKGRFLEMRADDLFHSFPRPRNPAGQLTRQRDMMIEGEAVGGAVSVLPLDPGPIDGTAVHSRRRAGLEARHCKSKCINMLCDIDGRLIAGATGRDLGVGAEVDAAAEECAGSEHHGVRVQAAPVGRHDS